MWTKYIYFLKIYIYKKLYNSNSELFLFCFVNDFKITSGDLNNLYFT